MKILLVDDAVDSRKILANFIENLGHQVVQCGNGKEALKILMNEVFHLVLSDIKMPEMDGFELLKYMKGSSKFDDIEIILITGFGDVKGAVEAMRLGAYDYVLKPIDVKELSLILQRISEFILIKKEHRELKENFNEKVDLATEDIKKELEDYKKAYAREAGNVDIGIYSEKLEKIFNFGEKLHKNSDIPVLLEGETGSGKEIIARFIHFGRSESTAPFIALNCAAISPNLFESELFGYEAGAFTGGNPKGQKGKLEAASGGTIFLDEISELSPEFQAKLLRVLQEREFFKVGGLKKIPTDARFICATNSNIADDIAKGKLRKDLFYRLNVGHIQIPPLRERTEEIIPLTNVFLRQLRQKKQSTFASISENAKEMLLSHSWPGNIRELKSVIERISLLYNDSTILPKHLRLLTEDNLRLENNGGDPCIIDESSIELPNEGINLDKYTLNIVREALKKNNGNKTDTAKFLGITRAVLYTYLKQLED